MKCKSYSHFFFSAKIIISVYAIFKDQSFNDTLTNDIVSLEKLGSDTFSFLCKAILISIHNICFLEKQVNYLS